MHENGAAASRHARARIMVELDDQIVEVILSSQAVPWLAGFAADGAIVSAIAGVFAPGVIPADRTQGKQRMRTRHAIGAPPQPPQPETATRRRAVAFTFVGIDPASPKRDRQHELPRDQNPSRFWPRPGAHMQCFQSSFRHDPAAVA